MNELIGRYKLLSHGTYNLEGEFTPTSDFLSGELIYSGEGYLSVLIFFNDDTQEKRKFLAYSGTYEICGFDEVLHKINICSQTKRNKYQDDIYCRHRRPQGSEHDANVTNATTELREYKLRENLLFLSCLLEDKKKFEAKWELVD